MASLLSSFISLTPPNLPKFSKIGFNHGTNPTLSILPKPIKSSTKIQTQIQSSLKISCSHEPNPSVLTVFAQKAAILIVGSLLLLGRFNHRPALALEDASKTGFSEKMEEKKDSQEENEEDDEMYAKILERNPNDVEALKVVLYGKMRKGKMKEAVKYVERLIRLEPEEVEWRLLEALSYELMGDLGKAKKLFKEILKERPLLIRALHGIIYSLLDKREEADEHFEIYRNLIPEEYPQRGFINDIILAAKTESQEQLRKDFEPRSSRKI